MVSAVKISVCEVPRSIKRVAVASVGASITTSAVEIKLPAASFMQKASGRADDA